MNAMSAPRPEQELGDTLQISEIAGCLWMVFGQNLRIKVRDALLSLFQRKPHGRRIGSGAHLLLKSAIGQHRRAELLIQNRSDSGSNQSKPVIIIHDRSPAA